MVVSTLKTGQRMLVAGVLILCVKQRADEFLNDGDYGQKMWGTNRTRVIVALAKSDGGDNEEATSQRVRRRPMQKNQSLSAGSTARRRICSSFNCFSSTSEGACVSKHCAR